MALVKYRFKFLYILDLTCYIMTYPWMAMLSLFVSCFWTTTEEGKNPSKKFVHYLIYAPILAVINICTFPLAVFGYGAWILICNCKFHIFKTFLTCYLLSAFKISVNSYFRQSFDNH